MIRRLLLAAGVCACGLPPNAGPSQGTETSSCDAVPASSPAANPMPESQPPVLSQQTAATKETCCQTEPCTAADAKAPAHPPMSFRNDVCPVCLEKVTATIILPEQLTFAHLTSPDFLDTVFTPVCTKNHVFHYGCILNWILQHQRHDCTCPYCIEHVFTFMNKLCAQTVAVVLDKLAATETTTYAALLAYKRTNKRPAFGGEFTVGSFTEPLASYSALLTNLFTILKAFLQPLMCYTIKGIQGNESNIRGIGLMYISSRRAELSTPAGTPPAATPSPFLSFRVTACGCGREKAHRKRVLVPLVTVLADVAIATQALYNAFPTLSQAYLPDHLFRWIWVDLGCCNADLYPMAAVENMEDLAICVCAWTNHPANSAHWEMLYRLMGFRDAPSLTFKELCAMVAAWSPSPRNLFAVHRLLLCIQVSDDDTPRILATRRRYGQLLFVRLLHLRFGCCDDESTGSAADAVQTLGADAASGHAGPVPPAVVIPDDLIGLAFKLFVNFKYCLDILFNKSQEPGPHALTQDKGRMEFVRLIGMSMPWLAMTFECFSTAMAKYVLFCCVAVCSADMAALDAANGCDEASDNEKPANIPIGLPDVESEAGMRLGSVAVGSAHILVAQLSITDEATKAILERAVAGFLCSLSELRSLHAYIRAKAPALSANEIAIALRCADQYEDPQRRLIYAVVCNSTVSRQLYAAATVHYMNSLVDAQDALPEPNSFTLLKPITLQRVVSAICTNQITNDEAIVHILDEPSMIALTNAISRKIEQESRRERRRHATVAARERYRLLRQIRRKRRLPLSRIC